MATKKEEQAQEQPETKEVYIFNRATELVGYTFSDGKKFRTGVRYALDSAGVEKYAKHKHNGHQVLTKE